MVTEILISLIITMVVIIILLMIKKAMIADYVIFTRIDKEYREPSWKQKIEEAEEESSDQLPSEIQNIKPRKIIQPRYGSGSENLRWGVDVSCRPSPEIINWNQSA